MRIFYRFDPYKPPLKLRTLLNLKTNLSLLNALLHPFIHQIRTVREQTLNSQISTNPDPQNIFRSNFVFSSLKKGLKIGNILLSVVKKMSVA